MARSRTPLLALFVVALTPLATQAQDHHFPVTLTSNTTAEEPTFTLEVSVSWDGAWRDDHNHDALWIVLRAGSRETGWLPIALESVTPLHDDASAAPLEAHVPHDGVGAFIRFASPARGTAAATLTARPTPDSASQLLQLDDPQLIAIATEMVYVPAGGFWIGDTSERALEHASFFRADEQGNPAARFRVESEAPIDVGPGALLYDPGEGNAAQYRGDAQGPVPESFPKGTNAFYIMKREPTQGLYAAYLNQLSPEAQQQRRPDLAPGYREGRGTLTLTRRRQWQADSPNLPLNYATWDDGMGLLDWLGLRPMTELEFTKACRGDLDTPADDYPWGTTSTHALERTRNDAGFLLEPDRSSANPDHRPALGASPYGVEDLAGSTWERCVTLGHPLGRAFQGTHGDGITTELGLATNPDWPNGADGGIGYRGGGHYYADHDYRPASFNPHSPVSWRPYASWKDGPRSVAYAQRGVRTAD